MPRPYNLEVAPAAKRNLKRLPLAVRNDIVFTHLPAIQADPLSLSEPLGGVLKGERAYHFGRKPAYRIIFYLEGDLITVTIIGTREGIYKRAMRRKK